MKENRIGTKLAAGLAVTAAVLVGIAPAAQARDTGWDTTKIVKEGSGLDRPSFRDTGWDTTG